MKSDSLFAQLSTEGLVAVVVLNSLEEALPVVESLAEGGIRVIELAQRTPVSVEALAFLANRMPGILIGAGTVLTKEQVRQVADAGAKFALAPGTNPAVLEEAAKMDFPFLPGVATPSDIETALSWKCRHLKYFPAEPLGGIAYLKAMATPYLHLNPRFLPLGGANESTMAAYLGDPMIFAIGGSWIASRARIEAKDWKAITQHAAGAVEAIRTRKKTA